MAGALAQSVERCVGGRSKPVDDPQCHCCWKSMQKQPEPSLAGAVWHTDILEVTDNDDDEWRYFITTSDYASQKPPSPPASLKELLESEVLS